MGNLIPNQKLVADQRAIVTTYSRGMRAMEPFMFDVICGCGMRKWGHGGELRRSVTTYIEDSQFCNS